MLKNIHILYDILIHICGHVCIGLSYDMNTFSTYHPLESCDGGHICLTWVGASDIVHVEAMVTSIPSSRGIQSCVVSLQTLSYIYIIYTILSCH